MRSILSLAIVLLIAGIAAENMSVEAPIEPLMYSLSHCKHGKAPTSNHDQVTSIKMRQKEIPPSLENGNSIEAKGGRGGSGRSGGGQTSAANRKVVSHPFSVLRIPVPLLKSLLSTGRALAPPSKVSVSSQHHACEHLSPLSLSGLRHVASGSQSKRRYSC